MARDDEGLRAPTEGPMSEPDIEILLAQTWRARPDAGLDLEEICRIWAFDLGWFDMRTATRVRDNLLETGWLELRGGALHPSPDVASIEIPFAWLPVMRVLDAPPMAPEPAAPAAEPSPEVQIDEPAPSAAPIDPAAAGITDLLAEIAETSGLERKEVMRRANRKRLALGPVTLWMALLLVAREQQLSMPGLVLRLDA